MIGRFARSFGLLVALLLLLAPFAQRTPVLAASAADIQSQIDTHNQQIQALQAEIAQYQQQITVLGSKKQTLQTSIKSIDISRQQTAAQIRIIQNKIAGALLQIGRLNSQISDKQQVIDLDKKTLAASIRQVASGDSTSLVEQVFSADTLAGAWAQADAQSAIMEAIRGHAQELASIKVQLSAQQSAVTDTKNQLTTLDTDLTHQKQALDANKQAKATLLAQTKNQESAYQTLVAKKRAQEQAFEAELSSLEDSLKTTVDASKIAHAGSGVLSWPFSASVMASCKSKQGAVGNPFCITQYFGTTPFSTSNPQVYNGNGHNAIDIGVPIGTPVQAALSGTVLATGNTDLISGCYSFGKWVMLKHPNGLATLYSHLSSIQVSGGQSVSSGQVIGLSGMTGYATGPHLHFGVYASQGVQILTLRDFRGATSPCANASMPVAPKSAYLNPMSYL